MQRLILGLILAGALGLRVWLAAGGGQGYWPDELMRYGEARTAAYFLSRGEWEQALPDLFGRADHQLFRWVALVPALMDTWWGANPWRSACWFSLFSVGCIGLVGRIARLSGAGPREACWAAAVAAAAATLFFYARHHLPYDAALFFLLLALSTALAGDGRGRMLTAGCWAGVAFLTYNGYWLSVGVVGAISVFQAAGWAGRFHRAIWMGLGLVMPVALTIGVGRAAGFDLLELYRANSGTIIQGDFGFGWRVIAEYLWHAEHGLALGWLLVGGWAGWAWAKGTLAPRAAQWLVGAILVVAGLIALSDVVEKFVVYGRLVRQVVPFLCLLTGYVVERQLAARSGRKWTMGVAALLLVVSAPNFVGPLRQQFPTDFEVRARRAAQEFQRQAIGVFALQNVEFLWAKQPEALPEGARVVLRAAHPFQFQPYLYEGFSASERREFRRADIAAMRLIDNAARVASPELQERIARERRFMPLQLDFRLSQAVSGRAEPLLTFGVPTRGDFLFVREIAADQISIGLDHWGGDLIESRPIKIDRAAPVQVAISCPVFYPPSPEGGSVAEVLRGDLLVMVNGETVLCRPAAMHASSPVDVMIGWNLIGGSTTARQFSGAIERITVVPSELLVRAHPSLAFATVRRESPRWSGAPGPIKFSLEVPVRSEEGRAAQPLASSGLGSEGDLLLGKIDEHGRLQFSLWHGGELHHAPVAMPVTPGQQLRMQVSLGSFWPERGAPLYAGKPGRESGRSRLRVRVEDLLVWEENFEFFPAQGRWRVAGHDLQTDLAPNRATWTIAQLEPWPQPGEAGAKNANFDRHPGALRLRMLLPDAPAGTAEPLITTGVTGGGDFLFVRFEAGRKCRIGFDHWGAGGPISEPVAFDPEVPLEIVASFGALYAPDATAMANRLYVSVNGAVVLDQEAGSHASTPGQIRLGQNPIGGSSSGVEFTGEILDYTSVAAEASSGTPRGGP